MTKRPLPGLLGCKATVAVILACGHREIVIVDIECVAAHPFYLRPGQTMPCKKCTSGWRGEWHPREEITATVYGYTVPENYTGRGPDPDQERPQGRPYQHHHAAPENGPHHVAGFAIVRAQMDDYGPNVVEVDWIPGSGSYADAVTAVGEWNDRTPDAPHHVIVPVHADGCRRDRW